MARRFLAGRAGQGAIVAVLLVLSILAAPLAARAQAPTDVVKVGIIPIANMWPFFTAIEKGYFQEANIKVETVPVAGGAVLIEALAGGSLHTGYSNYISLFQARERGFDVAIVAPNDSAGKTDTSSMVIRADSPLKGPKDLEGRIVAVNTLRAINWLYAAEWMARHGGDPQKVRWIEVPFPQMIPAVVGGKADAAYVAEPFTTLAVEKGEARVLGHPFLAVDPQIVIAGFVASGRWVRSNPALVERFVRALYRGMDYVNAHPESAPEIISKFTRLTPEIIRKIPHPSFRHPMDVDALQRAADLTLKWNLITKRIDVREVLHSTAVK